MQSLITFFWTILRALDATIQPWQPGENAFEANPQLKDTAHPICKCLPQFWNAGFSFKDPKNMRQYADLRWTIWCRAHARIERVVWPPARFFAISTGKVTFDEWINIVPACDNKVFDQQPWRKSFCSYLCGNGHDGCIGLMCTTYETLKRSCERTLCHTHAASHSDDHPPPTPCICDAGRLSGKPCIMNRTHLDFKAMKSDFQHIFEPIVASGQLSTCPICCQHVTVVGSLLEHFEQSS